MDELSLYVLDITMNSVRAGADKISIELLEDGEWLTLVVSDNGHGMTKEQLKRLDSPFFTTRKTRKVGFGIPFLKMLAEMTGGEVRITSVHESESLEHGTKTVATFKTDHIDFIPLGDITETVKTLIQGSPDIDFTFRHKTNNGEVYISCSEMREVLGEVPLNEPMVLTWIGENLKEQYDGINM